MTIISSPFGPDRLRADARQQIGPAGRIAIIIPTLNEARHISTVIRSLAPQAKRLRAVIVVVDGGSKDNTLALVKAEGAHHTGIVLLHNPNRLQSAAINLAVAHFADQLDWIIRADAHAGYPVDFCEILLQEAQRTGADSIVVRMHATGMGLVQRNIATAQNAVFGNGGSLHRADTKGQFVSHGHHALMRVQAFTQVGGYDAGFSHNEDAELDHRLIAAGFRIWLTGATRIDYYPRDSLRRLAAQYARFGAGRAATAWKHPGTIRARHLVLIGLAPIALLAGAGAMIPLLVLPLALWLAACLSAGLATALRRRQSDMVLCGWPAAVMQMSWSFGFWMRFLENLAIWFWRRLNGRRKAATVTGEKR
jgi:succinoglycan biosynthesis protein ExoA